MILVLSHADDPHAACVLQLLEARGHESLLLDLAHFPADASITIDYDEPKNPLLHYQSAGTNRPLHEARSIWWRRPQAPNLGLADNDAFAFTHNEWQEALNGCWQLLPGRWMNPPANDEVASRKALQLKVAANVGLRVPRTLITSNPAAARSFIQAHGSGSTIFKTFSCTHALWRETRRVRDEEIALLEHVRTAPVIFQEFIPASADVRVTIIGNDVFPAAIYPAPASYDVDFRMSLGHARVEPCELPAALTERLQAFMNALGLVYAAIDLRVTPEGEYVFLEANTAGEFLFIEERTGQPITAALARWLATPDVQQSWSPVVVRERIAS